MKKGKKNQAYNIGSGEKTTYNELILKIADLLGVKDQLQINEIEGTPGDLMGCYADIQLARVDLGFEPQVGLEEGLRQMIYYERNGIK